MKNLPSSVISPLHPHYCPSTDLFLQGCRRWRQRCWRSSPSCRWRRTSPSSPPSRPPPRSPFSQLHPRGLCKCQVWIFGKKGRCCVFFCFKAQHTFPVTWGWPGTLRWCFLSSWKSSNGYKRLSKIFYCNRLLHQMIKPTKKQKENLRTMFSVV